MSDNITKYLFTYTYQNPDGRTGTTDCYANLANAEQLTQEHIEWVRDKMKKDNGHSALLFVNIIKLAA